MQEEVEVMDTAGQMQRMSDDLDTFTQMRANAERYGYRDIGLHAESIRLFQCTGCANVVAVIGQQQAFRVETNPLVRHATFCMYVTLGIRVIRANRTDEQEQGA
jgi:hypothetical protein